MKFQLNNEEVTFNICRSIRQSSGIQSISVISYRVEESSEVQIAECLGVKALEAVIMNFDSNDIDEYGSLVAALDQVNVCFKPKKFELDVQHHESPPVKQSIDEAPKLELKPLPHHLSYVFLGKDDTFLVLLFH